MNKAHMASKSSKASNGMTLDGLALLIKQGFDSVDERFDRVEGRLGNLEVGQEQMTVRLDNLEEGQEQMTIRLGALEEGQEHIKLRLDNVAYRFEINELGQRVLRLENKLGLGSV